MTSPRTVCSTSSHTGEVNNNSIVIQLCVSCMEYIETFSGGSQKLLTRNCVFQQPGSETELLVAFSHEASNSVRELPVTQKMHYSFAIRFAFFCRCICTTRHVARICRVWPTLLPSSTSAMSSAATPPNTCCVHSLKTRSPSTLGPNPPRSPSLCILTQGIRHQS